MLIARTSWCRPALVLGAWMMMVQLMGSLQSLQSPLCVSALSWDRLPYHPPARSGSTLVALPLSWAFPNLSAPVAVDFLSTLPDDAPALNVSSLLLSFGGETDAGPVDELFALLYPPQLLPLGRVVYVRPVATGVRPLARLQHAAAVVPNRMPRHIRPRHLHYSPGWMLLFGGADTAREMNSLWLYDLNINQFVGLGPFPSQAAQADGAVAPLPAGSSLIDLGVPLDESLHAETMQSSTVDWQGCLWPSARSLSAMVLMEIPDGNDTSSTSLHVFLHGGHFQGVYAGMFHVWGDMWSLQVDSADFFSVLNVQAQSADGAFVANATRPGPCLPWKLLHASNASEVAPGSAPPPRYGHAIAGCGSTSERALYLFGGASSALYDGFLDDLWRYDLRARAWNMIVATVAPTTSQRPTGAPIMAATVATAAAYGEEEPDPEPSPCASSGSGLMVPSARSYHSLFVVGRELYLVMGAQNLLTPQPFTFAFNLSELHRQNPALLLQQGAAAVAVGAPIANLSCVNCWVGLNNTLVQDESVPAHDTQVLRGAAAALPVLVDARTGRTDLVVYGGLPSTNQASKDVYVVSVEPARRSAVCPALLGQDVAARVLPLPPLPYYANVDAASACANLTRAASGSLSRPGAPEARAYHSGAGLDDATFLFGGSTGLGQNLVALDDLWRYSMVEDAWTALGRGDGHGRRDGFPEQLWPAARISPSIQMWMRPMTTPAAAGSAGRSGAQGDAGALVPTLLMMGGGTTGSTFFSDLWLYDLGPGLWREQATTVRGDVTLRGRYGHFGAITAGRFYWYVHCAAV